MVWTTFLLFQMLVKKMLGIYEVVMEGTHPDYGSLITFNRVRIWLAIINFIKFLVKVQGKVQKLYLKTVTVTVIIPSSSSTSGMKIVGSQV